MLQIIARELPIFCIVGTGMITESVKDNQYIEANFNTGEVKIED